MISAAHSQFYPAAELHMRQLLHAVSLATTVREDYGPKGRFYRCTASVTFSTRADVFAPGKRVTNTGCATERPVDAEQEGVYALVVELVALGATYTWCKNKYCGYCATVREECQRVCAAKLFKQPLYLSIAGHLVAADRTDPLVRQFDALSLQWNEQQVADSQARTAESKARTAAIQERSAAAAKDELDFQAKMAAYDATIAAAKQSPWWTDRAHKD